MAEDKNQLVGEEKMDKMAVAPPDPDHPAAAGTDKNKRRQDKELEEGLEETFPASDPPANTQPGHGDPVPSSGAPDERSGKD